jgi:hypothetical protein
MRRRDQRRQQEAEPAQCQQAQNMSTFNRAQATCLQARGYENGKAWNMVIGTQTGRWGSSVVEENGSFALFGACALP